jgi:hypothetical protein
MLWHHEEQLKNMPIFGLGVFKGNFLLLAMLFSERVPTIHSDFAPIA